MQYADLMKTRQAACAGSEGPHSGRRLTPL